MKINEIESLVDYGDDPEFIYKAIRKYDKLIKDGKFPVQLENQHKEDLWNGIDKFQQILAGSNLLSARKLKNLAMIKSKIWIN